MILKSLAVAVIASSFALSGAAYAGMGHNPNADKQAIVITAFGTSMKTARQAIDNLVKDTKIAFPKADVRLSFTSNIIRRKLKREGVANVPSTPAMTLAELNDEGYQHVAVMPTHIIPGAEYDEIGEVVKAYRGIEGKYGFKDLRMGRVFLSSVAACDEVAGLLMEKFAEVPADEAVVLMGHGTPHHIANAMYCQLQVALNKVAPHRFYIGTVENTPLIEDVVAALKVDGKKNVLLAPLMIVAGDHANNDMADKDDDESWYSILTAAGFKVTPYVHGLGEDKFFRHAFVSHVKEMLK